MLVGVNHRAAQAFGECHTGINPIGHYHATTGEDHREFGIGQYVGGLGEGLFTTSATVKAHGLWNFDIQIAVEVVTRNIKLGGANFRHGTVKCAGGVFCHAVGVVNVCLVFNEFLKHRQLVGFLETTKAHAHGAGFRGNHHHWRMRPVGGCNKR